MSVKRHGLTPTVLRFLNDQIRRFVNFEICRVESASNSVYDWPDLEMYETRAVSKSEFHDNLSQELQVDYAWAFDRGDLCIGSVRNGEVVGFAFSSKLPTSVHENLLFKFPSGYMYGYASMTAPRHRGNRLEQERWKIQAKKEEEMYGSSIPSVWYTNVVNLEIRAASKNSGLKIDLHGYIVYARIFGHWLVYS